MPAHCFVCPKFLAGVECSDCKAEMRDEDSAWDAEQDRREQEPDDEEE